MLGVVPLVLGNPCLQTETGDRVYLSGYRPDIMDTKQLLENSQWSAYRSLVGFWGYCAVNTIDATIDSYREVNYGYAMRYYALAYHGLTYS